MATQTPEGFLLLGQSEMAEQTMRALELKGDLPSLVDPRFQLGLTVEDWTRPEYLFLRRMQSTAYRLAVAAGAGFPSVGQLVANGTRPLLVIEQLLITNATAGALLFNVYMAAASTVTFNGGAQQRDDRMRANIAAPLGIGSYLSGVLNTAAAPAVPAAGALIVSVPANSTLVLPVSWTLTGLAFFTIATVANNTALEAQVIGRERQLINSEF